MGEKFFSRVHPWKSLIHYGKSSKLTPLLVRPFKILERIGTISYGLALSPNLARVHDFFHVFVLRQYIHDVIHVLDWNVL